MGSSHPESQRFNQINWLSVPSPNPDVQVYQNLNDKNIHIERHRIETVSEQDFEKAKEFAYLRKNNPRWVSALYFEDSHSGQNEFCATKYQADLYLERIPIRLSNIRSIPFPDSLHLFDQALNGYCQFARNIGCFIVENDYIGINQRGVVKVWAGSRWEDVSVKSNSTTEVNMVRSIVNCLEECIDRNSLPPQYPSIGGFIYRNGPNINFQTALTEFKNYTIATNMGSIPNRLNSLEDTSIFYNNGGQVTEQFYQSKPAIKSEPIPIPVRYYSPQPYILPNQSSQNIIRREQFSPDQAEMLRRVNSTSNIPNFPQPPRFLNHQEIRTVGNVSGVVRPMIERPTIDRSLSNPQLLSGSQLRSIKQVTAQSTVPAGLNNRFGSNVTEIRQIPKLLTGSRPNPLREGSGVGVLNESKSLSIIKQQQLVIYPPSPTEIYKQLLAQPIQTSSRRDFNEKEQGSQSIIMQLTKSQANNPIQAFNETKYQENPNQYQSKIEYAPTIYKESQTSFKGTPSSHVDNKFFTPIGPNKKDISNLNSIQEVQTEHYWKEQSSKNNSQIKPEYNPNSEPYSLSYLKENYKVDKSETTLQNKYQAINSNDGKTSEDFLQKIKAMSTGFDIHKFSSDYSPKKYEDFASVKTDYRFGAKDYSTKLDYEFKLPTNTEYNYSFQKKKQFALSDAFNTESVVKQNNYDFGYKPFEYKSQVTASLYQPIAEQPNYEENFKSKYAFRASSSYNSGIDPELLEDLKKNQA